MNLFIYFYVILISFQKYYCISERNKEIKKENGTNRKSPDIELQDFIDIDLIKGSTFSKAKSNFSLSYVLIYGVIRLIFYPLNIKWLIFFMYSLCKLILYAFILKVEISNW